MSCESIPRAPVDPVRLKRITKDVDDFDEALWMSLNMGVSVKEAVRIMERHAQEHAALGLPPVRPLKRSGGAWVGTLDARSWVGSLEVKPASLPLEPSKPCQAIEAAKPDEFLRRFMQGDRAQQS